MSEKKEKPVELKKSSKPCKDCNGSGWLEIGEVICQACNGTGNK